MCNTKGNTKKKYKSKGWLYFPRIVKSVRGRKEGVGGSVLWVAWLSRLDTVAMDSQSQCVGSVNKDEKEKLDKLYSLMPHLNRYNINININWHRLALFTRVIVFSKAVSQLDIVLEAITYIHQLKNKLRTQEMCKNEFWFIHRLRVNCDILLRTL